MTDADLAARDRELGLMALRLAAAAGRLVERKVADAGAHARLALTSRLDETPEGRPTIALAANSRSTKAAESRLAELCDGLHDEVQDAREAAFRSCWAYWCRVLPRHLLRANIDPKGPPDAILGRFRSIPYHGTTADRSIASAALPLVPALKTAIAAAGNRSVNSRSADGLIRTWEQRATRAMNSAAASLITDSVTLADRIAGRAAVRPELLASDPSLPDWTR